MKIRTGFVSNSSTSSFCIYGAMVGSWDDKEKITENGLELHRGDPNGDGEFYTGCTKDLKLRIEEHENRRHNARSWAAAMAGQLG